ncbi:glycoside hydrolase family 130 protein [Pyrococcus abyssi]|uniref:Glycosidase, PH1107-related n=1 Tax=Pyrococcus abyssi (strain GE5 / Orsay) TaxID=272844 RepID=Q9UZM0_PYRAB|nr:glycoside hydrolase family 130 protein [Pyrococcus abyssi]CAB50037.1 Hypothetical protein PAB1622 [Pyrococcus abyssi GE5]CCE70539.1 TPA: Glycosidase, PH1107-related [Pyrococcus abyssi GE5]
MLKKMPKPIIVPSENGFDSRCSYNPAVIREGSTYVMLYRGESEDGLTGRIGLALSSDGVSFVKHPLPVLEPELGCEIMGVEDPRIVKIGKDYLMTYTGYDGKIARLCLAISRNLLSWGKVGAIFDEFPGNYLRPKNWTKSGAILPEKVSGEYVMYFGDSNVWIAYSDDGLNWEYEREPVMKPRKGKFDSLLVEPGSPPVKVGDSIVLIYNSADENLVYRPGIAVFDADDPSRLVWRSEKPIMEPEYEWEVKGKVDNVIFVEGLVDLGEKVLLYYGAADKYVGLAIWEGTLRELIEKAGGGDVIQG